MHTLKYEAASFSDCADQNPRPWNHIWNLCLQRGNYFCHDRHSTRGSSFWNCQWPGRCSISIDPFQPMDLLNTNDGHPSIDVDCPLRILVAALTAPSPVSRTTLERVDITKAVQFWVKSLRGGQNAMLSAPNGVTFGRRNPKSVSLLWNLFSINVSVLNITHYLSRRRLLTYFHNLSSTPCFLWSSICTMVAGIKCEEISPHCPVKASIYGYYPNLGANVFFLVFFLLATIAHVFATVKWRTWTFGIVMFWGCVAETLGT